MLPGSLFVRLYNGRPERSIYAIWICLPNKLPEHHSNTWLRQTCHHRPSAGFRHGYGGYGR
jgi:hypothetical protein